MIDLIGGPDRDRTDDLFHAMEARSQLRHRPTCCRDATFLLSLLGRLSSISRTGHPEPNPSTSQSRVGKISHIKCWPERYTEIACAAGNTFP